MPRRPATVFVLAAILLDILGIGLIIPVLPRLVGELAGSRDAQTWWYGALVIGYGAMQFLCAPLLGALSDRHGRRPVLLAGIGGLAVMFLVPALTSSLWVLLASRIVGGMFAANLAVAQAYIADVTPPNKRAAAFGKLGAVFGLGFMLGPALGGVLAEFDLRLPFFVAAALAALNFLYGLFVLPESVPRDRRTPFDAARANPFSSLAAITRLKGVGALVVVIALMGLAQFLLHTTWPLYTEFRYGWSPLMIGISLFLVGVVMVLVQGVALPRLLRRLGEVRLVLAGLASAMLAYLGYGLATAGWVVLCIISVNLLAYAVGPTLQGIVSRSVDAAEQGRAMGALASLASLTAVIAPMIGTPLLAQVSDLPPEDWRVGTVYLLAAALQALALALAAWHFRHHPLRRAAPPGA
jgi:DHA1 family tetracycline resistance protein-like MFS transporter